MWAHLGTLMTGVGAPGIHHCARWRSLSSGAAAGSSSAWPCPAISVIRHQLTLVCARGCGMQQHDPACSRLMCMQGVPCSHMALPDPANTQMPAKMLVSTML